MYFAKPISLKTKMKHKILTIILTFIISFFPFLATAEDSDATGVISYESKTPASAEAPARNANNLNTVKDFSFLDLEGKRHEFKEYRGKWVIVNYWAPYCPPCRVEVTDLELFFRDHKHNAVILGMDAGGDPVSELKQFKKEYELSYTMAAAQQSTLLSFGIIDALPTTFVVSPQGQIMHKHIGMITYDDLADYTAQGKSGEKHAQR